ncbi:MAG TPA: GAF domain-containing sensor histidine kinase [Polyangiales bacterium]|nr:GAF domain-containing sensor histidine kinase [Polyangiales bacterium]
MPKTEHSRLTLLERLFELTPMAVDVVLSQSSDLIGEATGAEKVDAFLYEVGTDTLVAVGTSRTPLGKLQRSLGLHRLPVANADPVARVFSTGEIYHSGHTDQDPTQPRGVIERLRLRSMAGVPLHVNGQRRGVLTLASARPDAFSDDDVTLLKMVAAWVGSLVHRSELMDAFATQASAQSRRAAAEELITILAHDLRNLLNPIATRLAVVRERARSAQREDDVADAGRALAALGRISELMGDLLDVSRLEQGALAVQYESFDIVELVRRSAQTLSLAEVSIEAHSYVDTLAILADRRRLTQALENVLSNATKHSPRGAPVHVELRPTELPEGAAVKLTIIDRGPGIPADLLPRIFDRYVSGGGTGFGLGLYLARAIIEAHGGKIAVPSSGPKGTRCEIILPLTAAQPKSAPPGTIS